MTFSLIVPAFNVELYIDSCLESIVQQDFTDWECIVVDDGSEDGTADRIREWAQRDARIQVVSQHNQGLSAARNSGLERAKGRYVLFVDSDDLLVPECLFYLDHLTTKVGELDIVQFSWLEFDDGVDTMNAGPLSWGVELRTSQGEVLNSKQMESRERSLALARLPVPSWSRCYSRAYLHGFLFPVGLYFEDNLLYFYIQATNPTFGFLLAPLYLYRKRVGSITNPGRTHVSSKHQHDIREVFRLSSELVRDLGRADLLPLVAGRGAAQIGSVDERFSPKRASPPPTWFLRLLRLLPHVIYQRMPGRLKSN